MQLITSYILTLSLYHSLYFYINPILTIEYHKLITNFLFIYIAFHSELIILNTITFISELITPLHFRCLYHLKFINQIYFLWGRRD